MEYMSGPTVIAMRESGICVSGMARVQTSLQTETFTWGSTVMAEQKDTASTLGRMETFTAEFSKTG